MKLMRIAVNTHEKGSDEALEAEKWWPQDLVPFRLGCWLEDADIMCQTENDGLEHAKSVGQYGTFT